jgi:hypothetical protein
MNTARNIGTVILLAAVAVMLFGCNATMTQIKVPVPVECRETEPGRPVMPTEGLLPGVDIFKFTQAAIAEIERREAYEIKLRTALQACIAPLKP